MAAISAVQPKSPAGVQLDGSENLRGGPRWQLGLSVLAKANLLGRGSLLIIPLLHYSITPLLHQYISPLLAAHLGWPRAHLFPSSPFESVRVARICELRRSLAERVERRTKLADSPCSNVSYSAFLGQRYIVRL